MLFTVNNNNEIIFALLVSCQLAVFFSVRKKLEYEVVLKFEGPEIDSY